MRVADSLSTIRQPWLFKVSHALAKGEGVRESFLPLLSNFFDLLQQAVETGNPGWLEPMLDEWAEARTESELETQAGSLPSILDQILLEIFNAGRECLADNEALELTGAILPIFTHAFCYTTSKETALHVDYALRELIKAKERVEQLDRSKSDFISIAAHELKTPLTLIDGYSAMLSEQIRDSRNQPIDVDQADLLINGVDNGVRRLRAIVDDIIDVSMIDNHLLSLHFQPIWVIQLLQMAEKEFAETVRMRQQKLTILPFSGSDEMTYGDAERLYQGFRNVIGNAIKYTPDGGSILVDGRKLPGFLEIIVSDTGIGIDPENHTRIFEKFELIGNASLHSSGRTKFKGGGPGLGLPISKGIIEAHGGAIWVESERHDEIDCPGSTFHILLPMLLEPPEDRTKVLYRTTG